MEAKSLKGTARQAPDPDRELITKAMFNQTTADQSRPDAVTFTVKI